MRSWYLEEFRHSLSQAHSAKGSLVDSYCPSLTVSLSHQVALMKKRLKGVTDLTVPIEVEVSASEDAANSSAALRTPGKDTDAEAAAGNGQQAFD